MSDNPIADAGLKLYPMAEVQALRNEVLRLREAVKGAAEVLTKGNATMKKARKEIEQLREDEAGYRDSYGRQYNENKQLRKVLKEARAEILTVVPGFNPGGTLSLPVRTDMILRKIDLALKEK